MATTKTGGSGKASPETAEPTRAPARRHDDTIGPQTRTTADQPTKPKVGGSLRNEVLLPFGIGAVAVFVSIGIVAAGASQLGAPVVPIVAAAAIVLIAGLMAYVAWILQNAAARPLARVRAALR